LSTVLRGSCPPAAERDGAHAPQPPNGSPARVSAALLRGSRSRSPRWPG
jgi:hypothetical protein